MKKTAIGLICKETICTCSTRFCTFFCRCFARLQCETSRNFLVTRYMEEMLYVFLFTVFFALHVAHFYPGGSKHFLFSHRRYKISCCSSNKKCFLCFFSLALALSLVELRWPVALLSVFLRLSLSLYSKFVGMTINLSLILNTQKHFPFWLFSCLCLIRREWPYAFPPNW